MGLDYLQKKNWHPGSMRNREEVWLREQLQKEIMKKELERAKKLSEEKHNEELKRLQVEAGLIPKSHLERMEWMYEWGNKLHQQQKSAEEYLMGKPISMEEAEKLQKEKIKGNLPPIFKEEVTNARCEDFSKIHEDPLYFILQGEQKVKQDLYSNPIKLNRAIEMVESKKIKKEKKQKKNTKKRKNRSSSSSSSTSGRSQDHKSKKKSTSQTSQQSSNTSQVYQQYLEKSLGHLLVKDSQGNVKPDFGLMKRKNKPEYYKQQQDELRQKMLIDGKNILTQKQTNYDKMKNEDEIQEDKKGNNFIMDVRKQVYDNIGSDALGDRIRRNKHSLIKQQDQH